MSYYPQPPYNDPQPTAYGSQPRQQQPTRQDNYGPPEWQYEAPKRARTPRWHWIALAVALVLLASAGWYSYTHVFAKDSEIAACEKLASANGKLVNDGKADGKMDQTQYKQLRGYFADSRYADIKDHGTKLIDVLWQVQSLGEDPGLAALPYIGQLTTHMTGLQSACADHGIAFTVPATAAGTTTSQAEKAPKPVSAAMGRPIKVDSGDLQATYTLSRPTIKHSAEYGLKPQNGAWLLVFLRVDVAKGEAPTCACDISLVQADGKVNEFGMGGLTGYPDFSATELKAGQHADGWVVFDLPEDAIDGSKVQLKVSSLFADSAYGYWTVKA